MISNGTKEQYRGISNGTKEQYRGIFDTKLYINIDITLILGFIFSIFGPNIMEQKYISVGFHVIFDYTEYPCNMKGDDGCKFFINEGISNVDNVLPIGMSLYWLFFMFGLGYCLIQSKFKFVILRDQIRNYCIISIILNIIFQLIGLTIIYMYSKRLYKILAIPGSHTLYLGFSAVLVSFILPLYMYFHTNNI